MRLDHRLGLGLGLALMCIAAGCEEKVPDSKSTGQGSERPTQAAPAVVPLPKAEEVFEGHLAAIGGRDAIASIETLHIKSEVELAARHALGKTDMWWQRGTGELPASFAVRQSIEGRGSNAAGFDGKELWVSDDHDGLRTLDGREAELYQRGSSPFLIAEWKRHFESAKTLRRIGEGEASSIEVELITPLQERVLMQFNEQSGLLEQARFDLLSPRGPEAITMRTRDYRSVDGVRFAHEQRTSSPQGEIVTKVVEIESGVKVDPQLFVSPAGEERVHVDPRHDQP